MGKDSMGKETPCLPRARPSWGTMKRAPPEDFNGKLSQSKGGSRVVAPEPAHSKPRAKCVDPPASDSRRPSETAYGNESGSLWDRMPDDLVEMCLQNVAKVPSLEKNQVQRDILPSMGTCTRWRNLINDRMLDDEKDTPDNPDGFARWMCHPRRLSLPGSSHGMVQCLVVRSGSGKDRKYTMYHDPSRAGADMNIVAYSKQWGKALLSSRKSTTRRCSSLFYLYPAGGDMSESGYEFRTGMRMGPVTVASNFLGTTFRIEDQSGGSCDGFVHFDLNIGGFLGPRKMQIDINMVPLANKVLHMKSIGPAWHDELGCWCLDFRGRVTVASVKNFQLEADGEMLMQFGKVAENVFSCDFAAPLTPKQAFAISLTSLDSKLGCD